MDIAYIVRQGPNRELLYSLRSVVAHLPHHKVWMVGHLGYRLTGVEHLPTVQSGNKWQNAKANLRAALLCDAISDPFILMNDDFFVVQPVKRIPVLNLGTLDEQHAGYIARVGGSQYAAAMARTADLLRGYGIDEPLSYEAHVPMVVRKAEMLDALDLIGDDERLLERSVYGNLLGSKGKRVSDVKVYKRTDPIPDGPFLSTSDSSFQLLHVRTLMNRLFPTACQYEKRGSRNHVRVFVGRS